jgi:hypothetical protein
MQARAILSRDKKLELETFKAVSEPVVENKKLTVTQAKLF